MDYKGELDDYRRRKRELEDGQKQAYSVILTEYCTKAMRDRVEEHPEFTTKIRKDPIELLKVVMKLMHATRRAQYPVIDWLSGIRRFVNIRQEPNESLSDYFKRFSQEYDVFRHNLEAVCLMQQQ
jgi:hypothetical protein